MNSGNTLPISVTAISKSFPGVRALDGIEFDCRAGEVHALVGENGAGKSTLMRILMGVYQPENGEIRVNNDTVHITSPAKARELGIAMVYQDTKLVPDLNAIQNIFLGHEVGSLLLNYNTMRENVEALFARMKENFDIDEPVGGKPLAQRQIVELARALSTDARVLILDEPTSALTPREADNLFNILRELRNDGVAIIFISHKLPEVFSIADRITVLKDGIIVDTVEATNVDEDQIVSMMVGRELSYAFPPRSESIGDEVLQVEDFSDGNTFFDVNLSVRAGEIIGIGGIAGNGQKEIIRALYGLIPSVGSIRIKGVYQTNLSPADAISAGIVYLPSDRHGEGMFLPHSISDNVALPHIRDWARAGILDTHLQKDRVANQLSALNVKTSSAEKPIELLSGGNQQKVALARWLLSEPKICIFDEPTQGVDVGSKVEIYEIIRELGGRGVAVIIVSSDVVELIGLSDRIYIAAAGHLVDEVLARDASEERIIGSSVKTKQQQLSPKSKVPRITSPTGTSKRLLSKYLPPIMLALVTMVLCLFAANATEYFFTPRNLSALALQLSPLVLVALGQLLVIMLGGVDLSVGPVISLSTGIASILIVTEAPLGMAPGVLAILLAGLTVGLLNAFLIIYLKLPDLIATLATFSIVSGLALTIRPAPGGLVDFDFADSILSRWGAFPIAFIFSVLMVILIEVMLLRGRFGLRLIATGSSDEAAFAAGVSTKNIRAIAYMASGALASIAGIIVASRIGSGDPQSGTSFTLLSVTAVVLGGTSVFGGRGTAIGVLVASTLLIILQNVMSHLHVIGYWQYIVTGVLTIAAVSFYTARENNALH